MRFALLLGAVGVLAGCEDGAQMPAFLQAKDKPADSAPAQTTRTKLVERDVEAPEVFQVTEAGLWDGRPSLGGVWVAHPDVTEPERVIIRNAANGKFVIGALFRRERAIPGPRIQASSDTAAALGMLAGAPVKLNVTALRRETVEPEPDPEATAAATPDAPSEVTETTLDPIAGAAAAIDASAAPAKTAVKPTAKPAAKPATKPAATSRASALDKPYIQIGIFSVEANAKRTADQMRRTGMVPTLLEQESNGKQFWRVVVGPARNKSERAALLKKVKETGFSDAYAVTN
ncbi:MAG: SPOR domain-containing protein [Pseudodonghicola sp.]|nr:SPOR domain-containing protein [Pseudodonghicola sp.]